VQKESTGRVGDQMSEELYNSNDFCKLAEEFEELKKENAELSRDKDRLMNLFMERSEYVFNVVANMKIESLTQKCKALEADIESLTQKCKALEADYAVSNREMLLMQVEIGELKSELARRDEVIRKLKEDGERLFSGLKDFDGTRGWKICKFCHAEMEFVDHASDCPITLHRALMKKLE